MAMPGTARRYTVDEVLAFPADGNRYELVDGELLVTPGPAPRHQVVLQRLYLRVGTYLEAYPEIAQAFLAPADVYWGIEEYVQPDLFVVPADQVTPDWRTIHTLLLVAEVVSPSTSRADRVTKRGLYQRMGVGPYWVVDPDARLVEVWRPTDTRPEIVTDILRWRLADTVPEVEIALAAVFEGAREQRSK